MSSRKRSKAAAKGWVTRRANAARQRRSEAARRGWVARQAKAAKRSEAARKGWETRRHGLTGGKGGEVTTETFFPIGEGPSITRKVRWYETEEIERVGGEKKYKSKGGK